MTPALKLVLGAYKAQQAWRRLPPEERARIVETARGAIREQRAAAPTQAAEGASAKPTHETPAGGDAPGGPASQGPRSTSERAEEMARIAAALARQHGPVVAQRVVQQAAGRAGLAGKVATAIVRAQAKKRA